MKRIIMIVLLLVTGIGIIAYPFIGNYLNQKNATKVAENYKKMSINYHQKILRIFFKKPRLIMRIY